jgi:predicted dinucleotide-binding enzyme
MMPVAGDHAAAKSVVAKLIEELGFEAIDAGPLLPVEVTTLGMSLIVAGSVAMLTDAGWRLRRYWRRFRGWEGVGIVRW